MKGLLTAAWKNLCHRFLLAIALVLLVALLFSGGSLLRAMIRSQAQTIEAMTEQTEISCMLTNASGTKTAGIDVMSVPFAQMLEGKRRDRGCTLDDYVENLRVVAREDLKSPEKATLIRANCPEAVIESGLKLELYDGADASFLSGTEQVCCISSNLAWRVDEDGMIRLDRRLAELGYPPATLKVIGTVSGEDDMIVCPFDAQLIEDGSETFLIDRCSFMLSDTSRLDEAKAAFFETESEWFVEPSMKNQDSSGVAGILFQDAEYTAATDELSAHIALLERLRIVLLVLSGVIGLLIGFLMNRKRLREFAVMRCLGLRRGSVMLSVALEQLLPMLPGIGIGVCVSLALLPDGSGLLGGLLQMLLYLCGGLISAWAITRVEPIRLMKEEE